MHWSFGDLKRHERSKLLAAFVMPRPIASVTTVGRKGVVNDGGLRVDLPEESARVELDVDNSLRLIRRLVSYRSPPRRLGQHNG